MSKQRPPKAVYPHRRTYQKDGQEKVFQEGGINIREYVAAQVLAAYSIKVGPTEAIKTAPQLAEASFILADAYMGAMTTRHTPTGNFDDDTI